MKVFGLIFFGVLWWYTSFSWAVGIVVGIIVALLIWSGFIEKRSRNSGNEASTRAPQNKRPENNFDVDAKLKIKYMDGDGNSSQREIHVHSYTDSSPGYIEARCMKAKANRSFRTDRIKEAIDMETGEVIKRIPTFMRSK